MMMGGAQPKPGVVILDDDQSDVDSIDIVETSDRSYDSEQLETESESMSEDEDDDCVVLGASPSRPQEVPQNSSMNTGNQSRTRASTPPYPAANHTRTPLSPSQAASRIPKHEPGSASNHASHDQKRPSDLDTEQERIRLQWEKARLEKQSRREQGRRPAPQNGVQLGRGGSIPTTQSPPVRPDSQTRPDSQMKAEAESSPLRSDSKDESSARGQPNEGMKAPADLDRQRPVNSAQQGDEGPAQATDTASPAQTAAEQAQAASQPTAGVAPAVRKPVNGAWDSPNVEVDVDWESVFQEQQPSTSSPKQVPSRCCQQPNRWAQRVKEIHLQQQLNRVRQQKEAPKNVQQGRPDADGVVPDAGPGRPSVLQPVVEVAREKVVLANLEEEVTATGEAVESLLGEREKLKASQDFQAADAVEWASRQQEIQKQREEAALARKRKRALAEREQETLNRQKQRLQELRSQQAQDESTQQRRDRIRGEVRRDLERRAASSKDMCSLLRTLGINVEGGFQPTEQQVTVAYRKALLKFHPDRAASLGNDLAQQVRNEETFKIISRLKETLPLVPDLLSGYRAPKRGYYY